ncbi:UMTA methyltransferase family protein [Pochonia chlamydosporia 170]|uniref:UMTA methyltransferase family protein n=1 Tax=Pochonia chlamydosporia 170 TaxID=1380566 RepID=A0A179F0T0_METCM|nr:UMTA methyltransferase family protein [Pochonia chlamydosporia 170]OAQ59031.1 UMTA methyltransferase family protein [Pochonia chlamydosporia 170]
MGVQKKAKLPVPKILRIPEVLDLILQTVSTQSCPDSHLKTTPSSLDVISTRPHNYFAMSEGSSTALYSPNREDPDMSQDNDLSASDEDSAYGGELPDTTVLAPEEVFEFETIYNREYHVYFQNGKYPYPSDDREKERQTDFHRHIKAYLAGEGPYGDHGLFSAPFNTRNGANILDIATGTGKWAIDMGDKFPEATITGIDLSPIQLEYVPLNVNFVIDDVELSWDDPARYDYVHCRHVGGCMQNFSLLIKRIYEHLKSEGWVEFHELSMEFMSTDNNKAGVGEELSELIRILNDACSKMGRILYPMQDLESRLSEAGFKQIQRRDFWLPVGDWPDNERDRNIGLAVKDYLWEGLEAITAVPLRGHLQLSKEETELLCAGARKDLIDKLLVRYECVIAQKGT